MQDVIIPILGMLIGLMICGTGISFFRQNKEDAESRRIFGIAALVGAVVFVVALLVLVL